jgi:hypothetical protein
MRRLPLLERLFVATPCQRDWEAMPGDQRVRNCASCKLPVHDLSAMTRAEAEALVARDQGRLCARFHRRADGTIATADEPGPRRRLRWLAAAAGAVGLAGQVDVSGRLAAYEPTAPTAELEQIEVIALSTQEHVTDVHVEHEPAPPPPRAEKLAEVPAIEHKTMGVILLRREAAFHDIVDDSSAGGGSDRGAR